MRIHGEYVQVAHQEDPFPWAVEAKHRNDILDLPCMANLPKHIFWKAWWQGCAAAYAANLEPMLVWKTTRREDVVAVADPKRFCDGGVMPFGALYPTVPPGIDPAYGYLSLYLLQDLLTYDRKKAVAA